MLDIIVDKLVPILNAYGYKLQLMSILLAKVSPETFDLSAVHTTKREISALQRAITPLEGVVSALIDLSRTTQEPKPTTGSQSDSDSAPNVSTFYYRDVLDHVVQTRSECDVHLEACKTLVEEYHTQRSTRQNEIMYGLTIVATVFIPAQFLTGVYGMNFENMPELQWENGYYIFWAVLVALAAVSYTYVARRSSSF